MPPVVQHSNAAHYSAETLTEATDRTVVTRAIRPVAVHPRTAPDLPGDGSEASP